MIGPDLDVRGGVSSVESLITDSEEFNSKFQLEFHPTHRDYSKAGKLLFAIYSLLGFIKKIALKDIDIIYIHMSFGASFFRKSIFALTCIICKKRYILHMHGSSFDSFYDNSSNLVKNYIRFILRRSISIIALTEEWKRFYGDIANNQNITVVYNSVNVPLTNQYDMNSKIVLFLGRLGERKGIYDLIDIAPEVLRNLPDARFVWAGDGDIEKVRGLVKEKGIHAQVEIPGWIDLSQKQDYFRKTCIYVLPSYSEGLPMSVLEAMAHGIPVITTNVGGMAEVIDHSRNGIIIQPGDKESLKNWIIKIFNDKSFRKSMSEESFIRTQTNYNSRVFIKNIIKVINKSLPKE